MITSIRYDEHYVKPQRYEQPSLAATIVNSNSPEDDSCIFPLMSPEDDSCITPLMSRFNSAMEFVSSCNGIVCVYDRRSVCGDKSTYLLNPLTRMFKQLPRPIRNCRLYPYVVDVVFGFDYLSHDFKVLRIAYALADNCGFVKVVEVQLYSSNDDLWRVIEVGSVLPSFEHSFGSVLQSGPVLDGVLYLDGGNVIVTFDLHNESFGLIKCPSFMQNRKSFVLDFEGSVALVVESNRDGSLDEKEVSLRTMEEVSDEVIWKRMLTFDAGSKEINWVHLHCGAEKFVGTTKLETVLYDYRKKETKHIKVPSRRTPIRFLNHTESFLSVEKSKGVEER